MWPWALVPLVPILNGAIYALSARVFLGRIKRLHRSDFSVF
jgi:hypothetical protein